MEQHIRSSGPGYHPFTDENRPFEPRLWEYTTDFSRFVDELANFTLPGGTCYRETDDDWWTFDYSLSDCYYDHLGRRLKG